MSWDDVTPPAVFESEDHWQQWADGLGVEWEPGQEGEQMERQPVGQQKVWTILNVRGWMRVFVQAGQTPRQLAQAAAEAFGTWDMLRHLEPGDHWVFDVAAEAIERNEDEVKACRQWAEGLRAS
jgi:hypothetical protein